VSDAVADGELLKAFELSRQKYKTRKQQVRQLAVFRSVVQQQQQQQQQAAELSKGKQCLQAAADMCSRHDMQGIMVICFAATKAAAAAGVGGVGQGPNDTA
jgi:hypothetical protein